MKAILNIFIVLLFCAGVPANTSIENSLEDSRFQDTVKKWFSAWKLVSEDIFKIRHRGEVEFVIFDDRYVYSNSKTTIPNGTTIEGPSFLNSPLDWKKELHRNSLTLPTGKRVPVGLMSFASGIEGTDRSFLVMPLTEFWEKAGVVSDELGLENLVTGVFLHEFSHVWQSRGFGTQIAKYEKLNDFGIDFTDDLIQDLFEKNEGYSRLYETEVVTFYDALEEKNKDGKRKKIAEALTKLRQRQNIYFVNEYKNLRDLEELFLTMEGLGQYSMYLWLVHPNGGNLSKELAIAGVRRGKNHWSQDEGFALFLLMEQFEKPRKWAKKMFGNEPVSVIDLLNKKR